MKSLRHHTLGLHTKATVGSDGEREFSLFANSKIDDQSSLSFSGILGETDGFYTLREDQRGSVDRKANSEVSSFSIGYDFEVEDLWRIEVNANRFDEDRVNGTPLAVNGTEATDISASALRVFDDGSSGLKMIVYHQDRDFQNQFTAVADDRNSERPALNPIRRACFGKRGQPTLLHSNRRHPRLFNRGRFPRCRWIRGRTIPQSWSGLYLPSRSWRRAGIHRHIFHRPIAAFRQHLINGISATR